MSKCDCGHDHEHVHSHEHVHDENCDCGCNHEHDHNHNHDENCDCGGHEHTHEHVHDENCDCGCNHEHDHNHKHGQHNGNDSELYTEDVNTPVVYSTERIINCETETSPETITNTYIDKMNLLATWIEEQGGLIGHLKMLIQDTVNEGELWLSCAGASTTTNSSGTWTDAKNITNYKIGFTSIVIGINEASLANKISELLV